MLSVRVLLNFFKLSPLEELFVVFKFSEKMRKRGPLAIYLQPKVISCVFPQLLYYHVKALLCCLATLDELLRVLSSFVFFVVAFTFVRVLA
jgi:hypothetical protein